MAENGPTAEELAAAKSFLKGSYALTLDTSGKIAAQLTQIGQLDEAYALMDAALKARPAPDRRLLTIAAPHDAPIDPGLRYKRGDALLLTTFLERLREALR